MSPWHEGMLERLVTYFASHPDVLGLLLLGSLSQPELHADDWSDIDVLVVVSPAALESFFPATEWMTSFGRLYTYSQSAGDLTRTTRVCFENFQRIDFVFATEESLANAEDWVRAPFFAQRKILFARSNALDEIVRLPSLPADISLTSDEQFLALVREFRFKSVLAVYKVVRNDLLIALHLSQDLVRDCCVLGMMLRDRATGTNIHKDGGMGNKLVAELEATRQPFTPAGILDSIRASHEVFERLAGEWSDMYPETRQLLFDWIESARGAVSK